MSNQGPRKDDIMPIRDQVLKRMLKMPPKPHKVEVRHARKARIKIAGTKAPSRTKKD